MKTNKNPYLKTQIEILKTLLDGSKKSQNQIAKETNYEKSTISHALDDLEKRKVINKETIKKESGYTNIGNYNNKLCWLTHDVDKEKHVLDFLREALKKDISLIPFLQKSDKVVSMLAKEVKPIEIKDCKPGILISELREKVQPDPLVKEMLRMSPSLFANCLRTNHLIKKWDSICGEIYSPVCNIVTSPETLFDVMGDSVLLKSIIMAFEHCVIEDRLKDEYTPAALNLLKDLKSGRTRIESFIKDKKSSH